MTARVRIIRYFLAALTLALWTGVDLPAAQPGWCYNICNSQGSCETPCLVDNDPAFESTCGMYSGGAGSGWCAASCESVCTFGTSSSTACYDFQDAYSTCGSFGIYLQCGDGVCAGSETSGSCSSDCGTPLIVPDDETEFETFGEFADTLDSQGALDGSGESAVVIASLACSYGYVDSEYCPTLDSGEWVPEPVAAAASLDIPLADGTPTAYGLNACSSAQKWGKFTGAMLVVTGVAGAVATFATGPIVPVAAGLMLAAGSSASWGGLYAGARAIQCMLASAPVAVAVRRLYGRRDAPVRVLAF